MYYPYGFWGFDPTYFLLIIGMLLSLAASAKLIKSLRLDSLL